MRGSMYLRAFWLLLLVAISGPALAFHARVVVIPSAAMKETLKATVVLPDAYARGTRDGDRYPVVYLLHGSGGDHTDWTSNTRIAALADRYHVILVMPDGGHELVHRQPVRLGQPLRDLHRRRSRVLRRFALPHDRHATCPRDHRKPAWAASARCASRSTGPTRSARSAASAARSIRAAARRAGHRPRIRRPRPPSVVLGPQRDRRQRQRVRARASRPDDRLRPRRRVRRLEPHAARTARRARRAARLCGTAGRPRGITGRMRSATRCGSSRRRSSSAAMRTVPRPMRRA